MQADLRSRRRIGSHLLLKSQYFATTGALPTGAFPYRPQPEQARTEVIARTTKAALPILIRSNSE
jgi:hypothetical protein